MDRTNHRTKIEAYRAVHYHEEEEGFIAWRMGSGDNTELLHIKVKDLRNGVGRRMLTAMLQRLTKKPPYCTVFGFTRKENVIACKFYKAMGFDLTLVKGVYQDGCAVVFSQTYAKLKELHNV